MNMQMIGRLIKWLAGQLTAPKDYDTSMWFAGPEFRESEDDTVYRSKTYPVYAMVQCVKVDLLDGVIVEESWLWMVFDFKGSQELHTLYQGHEPTRDRAMAVSLAHVVLKP
jgi:hypothetical protein